MSVDRRRAPVARGIRCVALSFALILFAGNVVHGQQDRYIEDLQRAYEALGGKSGLSRDPGYQRFKRRQPNLEREINAAIAEQNKAVDGTAEERRKVLELYRSRAESRGEAIDHYLYGRMLGATGDLERAASEFNRALELEICFFWAWDGLGVYYVNKGVLDRAISCFEKALSFEPTYLKTAVALTQCYARSGQHARAQLKLKELLGRPDVKADKERLTDLTLLLAHVYRQKKEWARCAEVVTDLIDKKLGDPRAYALRALAYANLELWRDAANDYRRLTGLLPEDQQSRYWMQLAQCLRHLGRNHEAADAYETGLKLAGSDFPEDARKSIRSRIDALRKRPAIEEPGKARLGLADYIKRLETSTEPKKRREAILFLAQAPRTLTDPQVISVINRAFLNALLDHDYFVRAKAIEQVAYRMPVEQTISLPIHLLSSKREHRLVRAMAASVLSEWHSPRPVPALVKALSTDDEYLFRNCHDTLNDLTLAWIEKVLPDDLTKKDMARIRKKWDAWYRKNRDRYRRYESKDD